MENPYENIDQFVHPQAPLPTIADNPTRDRRDQEGQLQVPTSPAWKVSDTTHVPAGMLVMNGQPNCRVVE